jgi:tRNA(adenine34) deaminase
VDGQRPRRGYATIAKSLPLVAHADRIGKTHPVNLMPTDPPAAAARLWTGLDKPWQEAFRQAWEALRSGNIAVGACASTSGGEIVYSARNRVNDGEGPAGEIFGSALAHAETNVLARLPFRHRRDLVLTTTLQPCLQCAGAIRLGPIATVRFAGPDRYWDGCHDFAKLSAHEAHRTQPTRIGPRRDELGTFATLISRFVHLPPTYEQALRTLGEGPMVDLVHELEDDGEVEHLAAMDVIGGLGYLWPRLQALTKLRSA